MSNYKNCDISSISGKRAQNALIKTVLNGSSRLIFAEGKRAKTEQPLLRPFRFGALHMAQIMGASIVSMAMTRIDNWRVKIRVASPLYIDKGDILETRMTEVRQIIMKLCF